jgi:pyruvate/2-oxoglutarate dehydrogenase complex dihydrolipoamide acyltransferase (E2) component
MAQVIVMPRMGQNMEAGEIVEWKKKEGDSVEKGEVLLDIQTEKSTLEVESDFSGILVKIFATPETGEIPCLEPIAILADPGETVDVDEVLNDFRARQGA